ncbi:helix-turn-helix domain-containing protein (plasmid) [Pseudorhodobacter turbinis]|uniref:Helix-turn-helix domain-containing protein n=1 Tax=Pseudorhodobacter turbinis TaxID=2500533 RepID=A0A4P8EJR0_9RHOB|nr:XRE family transcriptional regulator [Pseudorhodobacter turbinis]QCO57228.1 helix-turn-helix domain-containing protein [Pseudorhodobacter turbinis]
MQPSMAPEVMLDGKPQIGARLRFRRKLRGMSLKQVAQGAGLSIGMISQVERGLALPSVKSMRAICAALDMPVAWLFEPASQKPEDNSDYVVRNESRRELSFDDGKLRKQLLTPDTQPQIQMLRFMMQPGADSGEPYSNTEGGKCGLVVGGTLGLELDGMSHIIKKGDSFAFPAWTMVRFWTIGDTPCEVIWVVSPATV